MKDDWLNEYWIYEEKKKVRRKSNGKEESQEEKQWQFFTYDEGLCVQCMHIGPYDNEPETIEKMKNYAREQGYEPDFSQGRFHHEIYFTGVSAAKAAINSSTVKSRNQNPVKAQRQYFFGRGFAFSHARIESFFLYRNTQAITVKIPIMP